MNKTREMTLTERIIEKAIWILLIISAFFILNTLFFPGKTTSHRYSDDYYENADYPAGVPF